MPGSDVEVVIVGGGAAGVAAGAAALRRRRRLSCCRSSSAARRPGVDRHRRVRFCFGSRLRLAAFRRPQSVGRRRGETGRFDRQNPAAVGASVARSRVPARGAGRISAMAMDAFFARLERSRPRARPTFRPRLSRSEAPLERTSSTPSAPISAGPNSDRVSAKDLDRYADSGVNWRVFEGLRLRHQRLRGGHAGHARLPGAPDRSSRQALANSKPRKARSPPIKSSSRFRARCWRPSE